MAENPVAELLPQNPVVCPDGLPLQIQAFDSEGGLKTLMVGRATVALSAQPGGGITMIQGKAEVDAQGYRKLNQIAGLHVLNPPTVYVDGEARGNPYYHRHKDPQTGQILFIDRVVISKAVAGLSPLGKMVVVQKTLEFDVATYLNEMMLNVVRKVPAAGTLGLKDQRPTHFDDGKREIAEGDPVEFYPIHGDRTGVWLNLQHRAVLDMWSDYNSLLKFISRRAETTILRLCFQDHPAIAAKKVALFDGTARIPVFFHRDGLTPAQVKQLEASLGVGTPPPPPEADVDMDIQADVVTGEDATAAVVGEDDDLAHEAAESPEGSDLFATGPDDEGRGFND